MNTIQGVSVYAIRKAFLESGIEDGDVLIFSELMDSRTLALTANADTVYFWTFLDLSQGPLVLETPADTLGLLDDIWFRWVSDFGLPGADRGQGGTYLLAGPGYDGPLPEGGYYVRHSRANHVLLVGRAFINENPGMDPAPTVARIKEELKLYPYAAGGLGSSIGAYLTGKGALGQPGTPKSPRFVEGTGLAVNTVPPNDFGHYEMLDALVQLEPAEALDTELAGQFAAIGIVKDEKFAPDARLRKILDEAVAVGNAASRIHGMGASPTEGWRYYDGDSAWWNMLSSARPRPRTAIRGLRPWGRVCGLGARGCPRPRLEGWTGARSGGGGRGAAAACRRHSWRWYAVVREAQQSGLFSGVGGAPRAERTCVRGGRRGAGPATCYLIATSAPLREAGNPR